MLRLLSYLCCLLALGPALLGQTRPTAPADGIHDDTRVFGPEIRNQLSAEIRKFREEFGADAWLMAITFMPQEQTLRAESLAMRRAWSGEREAILLAYDRATDKESLTLSPGLWAELPTTELFMLRESLRSIMSDSTKPPETRLREGMISVMRGLTAMRERESRVSHTFTHDYYRLAKNFGAALLLGAVGFGLGGIFTRRRDIRAARQCLLPQIYATPRLGAPYSGGAAVSWQNHSSDLS